MFEDLLVRRDEMNSQIESGDLKAKDVEKALSAINEILGDGPVVIDPLVDQWERDLAEGRIPDLDAE